MQPKPYHLLSKKIHSRIVGNFLIETWVYLQQSEIYTYITPIKPRTHALVKEHNALYKVRHHNYGSIGSILSNN